MTIDCRADFPLLARRDAPIYLDSAASSLKPRRVIDAVAHCLAEYPANVHRSGHRLGERASSEVEATRLEVARFINARPEEIIFTSGATESINLVVNSLITSGDEEVALLGDGHNSSWLPVRERGRVFQSFNLEEDLRRKPSLLIVTACSNVTGTLVDVQSAVELAHHAGVPVLVDGAQSVPHMTTDVSDLGCDFLAFSGHKMLAPSGVGVLYCAPAWHERLVPLQHGGGTISAFAGDDAVSRLSLPRGFEAGTPNVPGIVGLGEAIRYLRGIGMGRIAAHSIRLHAKLQAALTMVSQVDPGG